MSYAGEQLGHLVVFALKERRWSDDDIALLRTAAQIFANAVARERYVSEREALRVRFNPVPAAGGDRDACRRDCA